MRTRVLVVASLFLLTAALSGADLQTTLQAERSKLLAGSKTRVGVVLNLQAPDAPAGVPAATVQLCVVIDHSGSMSSAGKMEMVHIAGDELVDRLDSTDQLGVVAYDSRVELVRPLSVIVDAPGVKKLIRDLHPASGTNLGGGLKEGIDLFKGDRVATTARRLMLLTDGLANEGVTDPETLATWAKEAFLKGTRVSTIGLGADYNEQLLKKIAHAGGGEYYYVTKREDLPELFRAEVLEGRTVVAADVKATMRTKDGAKFLEVVGYPATGGDEKAREVKIGDLYAKQKRPLLLYFELTPPDTANNNAWPAVDVEVTWFDAAKNPRTASLPLSFGISSLESEVAESVNQDARVKVIEAENYRALDKAMDHMRKGDAQKALEVIKEAEERINKDKTAAGERSVIEQAGQLAQARRDIESGRNGNEVSKFNSDQGSFGQRGGGGSKMVAKQRMWSGGSVATESTTDTALGWLSRQVGPDGALDMKANGGSEADQQNGAALTLLSFLGAGHTEKVGTYSEHVRKLVSWLSARQDKDGRIGASGDLPAEPLARYRIICEHALATTALAEANGMSRNAATGQAAERAVKWLAGQNVFEIARKLEKNDQITSDDIAGLGWCVLALKSAKVAGIDVPADALEKARVFVASRQIKTSGTYGMFNDKAGLLDTAVGAVCAMYLGSKVDEVRASAEWTLAQTGGIPAPKMDETFNWQYVYLNNLLCFQCGGDSWKKWNDALKQTLIGSIQKDGNDKFTWPAIGTFKGRGRLLPTTIASLCMEVYYRYMPLYR